MLSKRILHSFNKSLNIILASTFTSRFINVQNNPKQSEKSLPKNPKNLLSGRRIYSKTVHTLCYRKSNNTMPRKLQSLCLCDGKLIPANEEIRQRNRTNPTIFGSNEINTRNLPKGTRAITETTEANTIMCFFKCLIGSNNRRTQGIKLT